MKKSLLKIFKIVFIGCVFSFCFTIFPLALENNNVRYTWNIEKSFKAESYEKELRSIRNSKLEEILNVEDIEPYFSDMNLLFDIAVEEHKLKEVEKIIADYERQYVFYEMVLLTENEELAKQYYDGFELSFDFERLF